MNHRRAPELAATAFALCLGLSCGSEPPPAGPSFGRQQPGGPPASPAAKPSQPRPGLTELDPAALPRAEVSRTVYVPVYSHIYTDDSAHPFNLAVTLSVRNTDRAEPLLVTAVRYHDSDGRLVRDYVTRPLRLAPLAAAEFFVRESDTAGGSSASFLVDWQAGRPVSDPVVEAVMVGTAMNQGVSFTSAGRPVNGPTR
jgi:hypothetical protein